MRFDTYIHQATLYYRAKLDFYIYSSYAIDDTTINVVFRVISRYYLLILKYVSIKMNEMSMRTKINTQLKKPVRTCINTCYMIPFGSSLSLYTLQM